MNEPKWTIAMRDKYPTFMDAYKRIRALEAERDATIRGREAAILREKDQRIRVEKAEAELAARDEAIKTRDGVADILAGKLKKAEAERDALKAENARLKGDIEALKADAEDAFQRGWNAHIRSHGSGGRDSGRESGGTDVREGSDSEGAEPIRQIGRPCRPAAKPAAPPPAPEMPRCAQNPEHSGPFYWTTYKNGEEGVLCEKCFDECLPLGRIDTGVEIEPPAPETPDERIDREQVELGSAEVPFPAPDPDGSHGKTETEWLGFGEPCPVCEAAMNGDEREQQEAQDAHDRGEHDEPPAKPEE